MNQVPRVFASLWRRLLADEVSSNPPRRCSHRGLRIKTSGGSRWVSSTVARRGLPWNRCSVSLLNNTAHAGLELHRIPCAAGILAGGLDS